jgi:hypothetical protein
VATGTPLNIPDSDRIANVALVVFALLVIPALVASLSRTTVIGWSWLWVFQLAAASAIWLAAIFRKRLSVRAKGLLLTLIPLLTGIAGMMRLGILANGDLMLVLAISFASAFFGLRGGLLVGAISTLAICAAWLASAQGWTTPEMSSEVYIKAPSTWLTLIITLGMLAGLGIFTMALLNRALGDKVSELEARDKELCQLNDKLKNEIAQRKATESKLQQLGNALPICASCKGIRDDEGKWQQLEAFFAEHAELLFSHGICPKCAKELYPDVDLSKIDEI